ncbi:MAG: 2-C-methyl-D-erythritol 4-phosphate cytidylyltransferase [Nitrospinota bacterium]|jgi:2-C-methyl-D-erythritol 4-phosphate cytidylyltransferase|nr:2-C-methyl-D-erythritol 4-phosphate cytidylyltransferase [Nitrospinota bacterium]MDP6366338.1 2-C-methyl-D-erythritol 4-phosphate cytidylyltransferase [Nitrospinota bacterium]MDP7169204.1 2-C-methyl-D-erythritol 4-phosphate cytidylyltransferase [Nitrospinota bacterium]MDP7371642.1 2-C-methyl-D-erythritol 4-phosphate cytidylyltransferase [Nitrospinota bacterium]MDP7504983.1 2-C-methyl-D-erythritol 4-phosphate cytidylyltransferase [Nitrospinota bacterium]
MTSIPPAEKVGAVVPAAGGGERLPGPVAKQFRELGGTPILHRTLWCLAEEGRVGFIALALPAAEVASFEPPAGLPVPVRPVAGGTERQYSVVNGLSALPPEVEWVIVHDGARPLLPPGLVEACLAGAQETGAAIAALPVSDTVKRANEGEFAEATVPRGDLWLAQTPQVARRELLERALALAAAEGFEGTDEAVLLEAAGIRVKLVPGSKFNFKITTPEDLAMAEAYLARAQGGGTAAPPPVGGVL